MKNRKKIGGIMFGGLLLAMNILPIALAAGLLTVGVSPSGSTITMGTPATFTATVKLNGGLTSFDTLKWSVNDPPADQTTSGKTSFTFNPTTAGTYTIMARATKLGSDPATGQATLIVKDGGNGGGTTQLLTVGITPSGATVNPGVPQNYDATVKLNGNLTSFDTLKWYFDGNSESTSYRNKTKFAVSSMTAGNHNVKVVANKGTYNEATANATLTVQTVTPPAETMAIHITPEEPGSTEVGTPKVTNFAANVTLDGRPFSPDVIQWYANDVFQSASGVNFTYSAPMIVGTYRIQAKAVDGGKNDAWSNSAYVYVNPTPDQPYFYLFEVNPSPVTLYLTPGADIQDLIYTARDSKTNSIIPDSMSWISNNPAIGHMDVIDQGRRFVADQVGATIITVTAKWQNKTLYDFVYVTVLDVPVTERVLGSVEITPPSTALTAGGNQPFSAQAYDLFHNPINSGVTYQWQINSNVSYTGYLNQAYGQNITFTANPGINNTFVGALTVNAYFNNQSPQSDSATIAISDVIIAQEVLARVDVTATRYSILTNDTTVLTAQAFSNLSNPWPATYSWQIESGNATLSSLTGQSVVLYSNIWTGPVTVRVWATNVNVVTNTSTIMVQGTIPPVNSINLVVTPQTPTIVTNNTQQFIARVYDGYGSNITSQVDYINWTNLNPTAGSIISQSRDTMIWRADSILGTFSNALRVETRWGNLTDTEYISPTVILSGPIPNYYITSIFTAVIKDGSTPSEGDIILYTVTLRNNQPNLVSGIQLTMNVPTYTTFISASSVVDHPRISGRTITWDTGTLYNGEGKTMIVEVQINDGLLKVGVSITGQAHVRADQIPQGFNITSNTIVVTSGSGPITPVTPTDEPLTPTGMDWQTLVLIAMASLLLASITWVGLEAKAQRRLQLN